MKSIEQKLIRFGLSTDLIRSVDPKLFEQHELARVVVVHKDSYTISNGEVEVLAEVVGKLMYNASSATDYPTVGDWVLVSFYDDTTFAIIHEVLPRTSLLKRKTAGKKIDFQLIAANIDVAFIMQSLNENFNIRRLERYLVMSHESNIKPVVLLSKSDLVSTQELAEIIAEIQQVMPDLPVVAFSTEVAGGVDQVARLLEPALTYCLLGSSGVGKTTLINTLIGAAVYETQTTSKKESKGRHTTTHRQLIKLASGAMIIDTPGMRELGNFSIETGLDDTFSEIVSLAEQCYFNDCSHSGEKGCAIAEAIESGEISVERLAGYSKMVKEAQFHEMSYLEKKKREKQFGKMCKTVMKNKHNMR
ncbi:ribosome small subunit-dependent GTPase A [Desulforhopalus sp. IMCC35007]|uniref:ribosome small subunit-dependent GTPase A n=1 Tax=Desulforhopalus sp. IMCC35007 TaxID=2569543 RepID=UPI0010AE1517|nr:ribosome small subunit-dependent GTPase A [Desulforhopalus sp. IMCC35007]TKB11167.1 ribosome small subunit-dependent GTPase A [Desulforhopalus sp. IMCC35007]